MKKIITIIIISVIIFLTNANNTNTINNIDITDSTQIKIDSLTSELKNEVNAYIIKSHKSCHPSISESIVDHGLENNIDICFIMSQAKLETAFGKVGIGRPTSKKSIFGVMSKKYKTYDEAVEHYITILNKYYLTNNRTEQDLLKKYTTSSGKRYASNPNYEKELKSIYNKIIKNTNINDLQNEINLLKETQLSTNQ